MVHGPAAPAASTGAGKTGRISGPTPDHRHYLTRFLDVFIKGQAAVKDHLCFYLSNIRFHWRKGSDVQNKSEKHWLAKVLYLKIM